MTPHQQNAPLVAVAHFCDGDSTISIILLMTQLHLHVQRHSSHARAGGSMLGQRQGWRLALVLFLVGVFLALQWIASRFQEPGSEPAAPHTRRPFVLDFTLPTLQGERMRLSDLQGQVVLVNFWATWCYPCRTEMPSINALYQAYHHKGLEILAVASDPQGREVVAPFVQAYALMFPILLDPNNAIGSRLPVQGLPTSYILDKQGRVAGMELGARNWNAVNVRRLIDILLAEEP
jgi:peroxiredoxin